MPTRGYRKGISDRKEPVNRSIRTHITGREFAAIEAECAARSLTKSKLLHTLVRAHVNQQRAELPHPKATNTAALRELTRLGNNLNQIAHEAHLMRLPLLERETRHCLATILAVVDRL